MREVNNVVVSILGFLFRAGVLAGAVILVVGIFIELTAWQSPEATEGPSRSALERDGRGRVVVTLSDDPSTFVLRDKNGAELLNFQLQQSGSFVFNLHNGLPVHSAGMMAADGSFRLSVANCTREQRLWGGVDGESFLETMDLRTKAVRRIRFTPGGDEMSNLRVPLQARNSKSRH